MVLAHRLGKLIEEFDSDFRSFDFGDEVDIALGAGRKF
jgi:hypothetical protein